MNSASSIQRRRFIYRGNAVAAAGHLRSVAGEHVRLDPRKPTIHGESSLPVIGGVSQSQVAKPRLLFDGNIEYGRCGTFASGTGTDAYTVTIVAASVDSVRVTASPTAEDGLHDVSTVSFRADLLSVGLRTTYPVNGEPRFQLLRRPDTTGMSIVRKFGRGRREEIKLRLEYDDDLLARETYSEFQRYPDQERRITGSSSGYLRTSIVRAIYRGDERIEGNVLREPGLGTIYFGEMLINDHNRRLTLVRIEIGSDPKGDFSAAAVDPNGIWD